MAISSATAHHGLQGIAEMTGAGVVGTVSVGTGATTTILTSATEAVSFSVELDGAYTVSLNLSTLAPIITGSGQAQVETVTVTAGAGATSNGNLTVTVTGANLTGSPIALSVALTTATHTTADLIAEAIKDAINANATIAAGYTATRSGANVILTDDSSRTNDTTLSVVISVGLGVSAATSANTTPGYAAAKCYRLAGTTYAGENFEGADAPTPVTYHGILVSVTSGAGISVAAGVLADTLGAGGVMQKHSASGIATSFDPSDSLLLGGTGTFSTATITLIYA